jgi:hypothetical protein
MPTDTNEPICVRCGLEVRVNRESYEIFERMHVETLRSGLPPHIAAKICGHALLDTTMGYAAIYPEVVIAHHRAFIARRRAERPGEEYRDLTATEWDEFLAHFELRKVALGPAAATSGPRARMKMRVSDAPSSALTQPRYRAWKRSTPTWATGSRRQRNKAGSARSPQSRQPWPPPPRNSRPCATSPPGPRARAFTSACRTSARPPGEAVQTRDVPRLSRRSLARGLQESWPGSGQDQVPGLHRVARHRRPGQILILTAIGAIAVRISSSP